MTAMTITERQASSMPSPDRDALLREAITFGHDLVIRAHVDDYSRTDANGDVVAPLVDGPVYTARAFAMVHLAMYDAFVGIGREDATYLSYDALPEVDGGAHSDPRLPGGLRAPALAAALPASGLITCAGAHVRRRRADLRWIAQWVAVQVAATNVISVVFPLANGEPSPVESFGMDFGNGRSRGNGGNNGRGNSGNNGRRRGNGGNNGRGNGGGGRANLDAVRVGEAFGARVAAAVIADRADDGAFRFPVFTEVPPPQRFRDHRPDPEIGPEPQLNYAAHWGMVDAFGYRNIRSRRIGAPRLPPPLRAGYRDDIAKVQRVGENIAEAVGNRTAEQTEVGIFWAYDGAFNIGVPPRLYNDAVDGIIRAARVPNAFRLVRLYAVVNVALADAGVAAWREKVWFAHSAGAACSAAQRAPFEFLSCALPPVRTTRCVLIARPSRARCLAQSATRPAMHELVLRLPLRTRTSPMPSWHPARARCRPRPVADHSLTHPALVQFRFNFWRPTIGLRNERRRFSRGLTPDPAWLPLGAPLTNSNNPQIFKNPSFPAYPSGHATFGAAALTAAARDLGLNSESFRFSFVSAEFDGMARAAGESQPRQLLSGGTTRSFTIEEAIEENNISRVYLGVHWDVDSEQGGRLGRAVGRTIASNFPRRA